MKKAFVAPLLLVLCLLALRPVKAEAQCIVATTDTIYIGPLLVGGFVEDTFDVFVDRSILLRFSHIDTPSRNAIEILSPAFPQSSVDSGRVTVRYRFRQQTRGLGGYTLSITDSNRPDTCKAIITFISSGTTATPEDSVFSIFNADIPVIALETDEDTILQEIEIRNTLNGTVIIDNVLIDDTKHFAIGELPTVPRILDPGQSIKFDLIFFSDTDGFFQTGVRLPSDHGLASEYFGVQVLSKITQGVVPPIRTESGIRISQNGTHIRIDGLSYERGEIQFYDVLGRLVLQHAHETSVVSIPKMGNDGERLSEGCYVIRLTDIERRRSETVKILLLDL